MIFDLKKVLIEACVASVESAIAAEQGGADRLELNIALELDGLTPSLGLFRQVRAACSLPIIVMIRPRGQGFLYTDHEFATMLEDIEIFKAAGADGFAFGFLTHDFRIDQDRTSRVVEKMGDTEKVVHRAFDITPSMNDALEKLIACGVDRVLTSGQAATAPAGSTQIKQLIDQAQGRIEILPGAGINPSNVAQLVAETGCNQVHGTFRSPAPPAPKASGLDALRAIAPPGTDANIVSAIRANLDK